MAAQTLSTLEGTVCIFTRPTVPGKTKTRLVARYGASGAARLAGAFLLDTYRMARELCVARVLLSLAEPGPLPRLEPPPEIWLQEPGDLGERMTEAARRALALDPSFVVIIGSDAPAVPTAVVELAIDQLKAGSASVLGPALDGGYYLLGLRTCPQHLLAELPWSEPSTLELTAQRLRDHGLRPKYLPTFFDVDVPSDILKLRRLIDGGARHLPHTARALRELQAP